MLSKRKIKRLSIVLAGLLVLLWFGGNLGLYLYMRHMIGPDNMHAFEELPQKLTLEEADVEGDTLHLMGFSLRFPFHGEDIQKIYPSLVFDHRLDSLSLLASRNNKRIITVSFDAYPDSLFQAEESFTSRAWNCILHKPSSYFELNQSIYSMRFSDYSWWNIPRNLNLFIRSTLKLMWLSSYKNIRVYEMETPHIKGILTEKGSRETGPTFIDLVFPWKDKTYTITFFTRSGSGVEYFRDILSTVRPIKDVEESYREMEALYKDKGKSGYPEELLLAAMISLDPKKEDLEELLKVMERNGDSPDYFREEMQKEIEYYWSR